ncbi:hypothetical protein [Paracraurococcus lichenis]|uniref:DUF3035 domain-containing protein n=1 Tax=Paracraurococcus lichenis TaxID=3064888 RepID=A0ABT9E954_9PROT|nr:hypothetical protein [Paracraurococcus sp. LOR1-02]MDO9712731.1 hypothetical protein [Paracraurococcus sp. LOR1-02]
MRNIVLAAGYMALLATAGCESNRLGSGSAISGGAGAQAGPGIGALLDARDRERAQAAQLAMLRQPLPPAFYQASYNAAPRYSQTPAYDRSLPVGPIARVTPPSRSRDTATGSDAAPAPATGGGGRLPGVPRAPNQQWVSDHSDASGTVTIISATAATAKQGECRTIREDVKAANGQRQSETSTHCETTAGAGDFRKI